MTLDIPTHIPKAEEDVQNNFPPSTPVEDYNCAISPHASKHGSKKRHAGSPVPERAASQARCLNPKDDILADFGPQSAWLPPSTTSHDYPPEFCSELEKKIVAEPWPWASTLV